MTRGAVVLLFGAAVAAVAFLPEIRQSAGYHDFFDHRTILGVPNFWNVVSNLPFLFVAIWGALVRPGKPEPAYTIVLLGTALTAFGSAYYHWSPNDATLFWDRLPMTLVFMGIFADVLGERALLFPLVAAGVASVLWWRWTGDLRAYAAVQFVPMLVIPLWLLTRRPRYTGTRWLWATAGLYVLAKLLELADRTLAGGHAWKHAAGAAALSCYVLYIRRRVPYGSFDKACPPSVL